MCSFTHNVAPRDKYIAFVSTYAETVCPQATIPSVHMPQQVHSRLQLSPTVQYRSHGRTLY